MVVGGGAVCKDKLTWQLEEMKNSLEGQEEEIRRFKERYMGELPEQLEANLHALDRFQREKDAAFETLQDMEQRRLLLQQQLTEYQPASSSHTGPTSLVGQLMALKTRLVELEARYTERYPEVIKIKKEIARIEERLKEGGEMRVDDQPLLVSDPVYQNLKRQYEMAGLEIESLKTEIRNLDQEIALYQKRVENTPKREQMLSTLTRDYEDIQRNYSAMLNKKLKRLLR